MAEEKKKGFLGQVLQGASPGGALGMLKMFSRSPGSKQCIADAKSQGATGREARQGCRSEYGSRLGNAGRSLGILPKEAKGISVSRFAQQQFLNRTPSQSGTINEFAFPSGGGTQVKTAGFNFQWWYILPLVLFVPALRKLIGFK